MVVFPQLNRRKIIGFNQEVKSIINSNILKYLLTNQFKGCQFENTPLFTFWPLEKFKNMQKHTKNISKGDIL